MKTKCNAFLSYSQHDLEVIKSYAISLRDSYNITLSEHTTAANYSLNTEIFDTIQRSNIILACISHNALLSKSFLREVKLLQSFNTIVVKLDDVELPECLKEFPMISSSLEAVLQALTKASHQT